MYFRFTGDLQSLKANVEYVLVQKDEHEQLQAENERQVYELQNTIEQLRAENKQVQLSDKLCPIGQTNTCGYWAKQQKQIQHLQAENKELKQNLLEFGRHSEGCSRTFGEKYRCKCGWLKVQQALKGK